MLQIKKRLLALSDRDLAFQLEKLFENLYNSQMLTSPALTVGATAAPTLGNAIAAVVGGLLVTKATATAMAALNGPTIQNTGSTFQAWLFAMDQAGTLTTYAGTPGATANAVVMPFVADQSSTSGLPQIVIGGLMINNASVGAFIPATTLLNVANVNPVPMNLTGPFFPIQYM